MEQRIQTVFVLSYYYVYPRVCVIAAHVQCGELTPSVRNDMRAFGVDLVPSALKIIKENKYVYSN